MVAVAGLNLALTLQNVWPSLWVRPTAELSFELLAIVLVLGLIAEWRSSLGKPARWVLTILLFLLVLGRYADITSHALFGRPINLYFDLQHLPRVIAMTAGARSTAEIALFVALLVVVPIALLFVLRAAAFAMTDAVALRPIRRAAVGVAGAGLVLFGLGQVAGLSAINKRFALPISPVYAKQASFAFEAALGAGATDRFHDTPSVSSDLGRLGNADVFLLFLESYGMIAHEAPELAPVLRPRMARMQRSLAESGWHAISGQFTAPTFGGASWLSHSSVLSGITISGNRDYQLLLSTKRKTLVSDFRRAGYRAVALMPGLKRAWPEGAFYGYDKIYDAKALAYAGPDFGWWTIPDQYSLEKFLRLEVDAPDRRPLFVVFPTIMSHMPFNPVPPYLPAWGRLLDDDAYSVPAGKPAAGAIGDWRALRESYRAAVGYNLSFLDGFLRNRAPEDALVVVAGDHQPPAIVSGSNAPWTVPVHVFSRRKPLLARFRNAGMQDGLIPPGHPLGDLASIHRIILQALDSRGR